MTEEAIHKCTACSCEYTDDEGGIQGDFGIMPMSFCPTCLSCMLDMADQLNLREWVGLTDEEIREILGRFYAYNPRIVSFAQEIQAKLKEKNT